MASAFLYTKTMHSLHILHSVVKFVQAKLLFYFLRHEKVSGRKELYAYRLHQAVH